MEMLTLSHVKKNFGGKEVLKDVTFSVPEHSVFGFVGLNGAGKTTTMKMILGLLPSDGGEITVPHFSSLKIIFPYLILGI